MALFEVEAVGGKTEIENAHGPVDLRKLKGGANLSNRYGRIVCIDVEGGIGRRWQSMQKFGGKTSVVMFRWRRPTKASN